MVDIVKPDISSVWAEAGAVIAPSNEKIKLGWTSEVPPHQYENFVQNRQDEMLAYLNQKGVPEWRTGTEYFLGKSFVQDAGKIYKANKNSGGLLPNQKPSTDATNEYWEQATFSLSDLKQAVGTSTKDVMSQKAVTDALNDKADTSALGTAATRDVGTDSGNVMQVGAFGLGNTSALPVLTDFVNNTTPTGFYIAYNATPNNPPDVGDNVLAVYCANPTGNSAQYIVKVNGAYNSNQNVWVGNAFTGTSVQWTRIIHTGNLQSTTGQSTDYPMTQKAVTDELNNKVDKIVAVTGSITLNGTTDNTVVMTDIVTELDLEIGDVIRIDTGAYNKLHTVESITDNSSIIVNYEHAGNRSNGSLKLPDFTGQATVTRIAKWFNAPIGLGQGWVDMITSRVLGNTYTNTTGRAIEIIISSSEITTLSQLTIDGVVVAQFLYNQSLELIVPISAKIPSGSTYKMNAETIRTWAELR